MQNNKKMHVLLITNFFPPDVNGRAEKMGRRVKYLVRFGWEVSVLAVDSGNTLGQYQGPTIQNIHVYREPYLLQKTWPSLKRLNRHPNNTKKFWKNLNDIFFLPKGYIRWFPFAIKKASQIAPHIDIILTVNNPIMLHLIGLFASKYSGKPWIAEIRDAISGYTYNRRGPKVVNNFLEKLIVTKSDGIIQWTDAVPNPIGERYPSISKDHFLSVGPIGYDPELFQTDANVDFNPRSSEEIIITYTGSFYGNTITPENILKATSKLNRRSNLTSADLQFRFAGDWSQDYDRLVDNLKLNNQVSYLGRISASECSELWKQSDVLLLILANDKQIQGVIPTKFWDYVAAQKPILCLAPQNSRLSQIILEHKIGYCVEPSDVEGIINILNHLISLNRRGNLKVEYQHDFLESSSCVNGEKEISSFMKKILNSKSSS